MAPAEMAEVFKKWNQGALDSYLVEITADVLAKTADVTGKPMVDVILDAAGQKGTGKWTSQAGLDLGVGIPQIAEAVFARCLSAIKDERVAAAKVLAGPAGKFAGDKAKFLADLEQAVYARDLLLRPGLPAPARGVGRIQVEPQLRERRPALARRVHHPRPLPRQDQGSLRRRSRAGEPAARAVLPKSRRRRAGRVAAHGRDRRRNWHPAPRHLHRARLLRRLPLPPACPRICCSPARLLRRPHLRAHGQAPRRVLPRQLDRPRRLDGPPRRMSSDPRRAAPQNAQFNLQTHQYVQHAGFTMKWMPAPCCGAIRPRSAPRRRQAPPNPAHHSRDDFIVRPVASIASHGLPCFFAKSIVSSDPHPVCRR